MQIGRISDWNRLFVIAILATVFFIIGCRGSDVVKSVMQQSYVVCVSSEQILDIIAARPSTSSEDREDLMLAVTALRNLRDALQVAMQLMSVPIPMTDTTDDIIVQRSHLRVSLNNLRDSVARARKEVD